MVAGDYFNDGYDSTLMVDFGTSGLWRYHANTGTWSQLSAASPDSNG